MILGQDVYHAIRPLEYFSADEKRSPVAVRLPIGGVLSGPLPSSSCLNSTCIKLNIEHDKELAIQKSHGTTLNHSGQTIRLTQDLQQTQMLTKSLRVPPYTMA